MARQGHHDQDHPKPPARYRVAEEPLCAAPSGLGRGTSLRCTALVNEPAQRGCKERSAATKSRNTGRAMHEGAGHSCAIFSGLRGTPRPSDGAQQWPDAGAFEFAGEEHSRRASEVVSRSPEPSTTPRGGRRTRPLRGAARARAKVNAWKQGEATKVRDSGQVFSSLILNSLRPRPCSSFSDCSETPVARSGEPMANSFTPKSSMS
jgi:hypothetical protein